ncbi:MAG TPA: hypothetical protein VGX28_01825 [Frankiaceae bacterium]|jgi:hypothetical protein|nr:hypothetical protein [Frankiaceae bacterium]
MGIPDANRWAAVLVSLGVLLPLGLWFARDAIGSRIRAAVTVLAAALLLLQAGGALGQASFLGVVVAPVGGIRESDRKGAYVTLYVAALAVALAVALALRPRDEVVAEPAVEQDEGAADDEAGDDAEWSSHEVESALPTPSVPFTGATYALLLVALALGLPLSRYPLGDGVPALMRLAHVSTDLVVLLLIEGLVVGLALLLPALLVGERERGAVVAAFAVVAVAKGVAAAWPDAISNNYWHMIGIGLVLGLLLPVALRLFRGAVVEDRLAIAVGVALAVALVATSTALEFRTTFYSAPDDEGVVNLVNVDGD